MTSRKPQYTTSMNNDTETFTIARIGSEPTDDGDRLITWEVRAKGFAGIREFQASHDRFIATWTGCGAGWLKGTYCVLVDGAEIAIEARNDAWASVQQDIEDHGRRMAGWF